jgi:hypothetical protein
LYTIDVKKLPKDRPGFINPFETDLKFNDSIQTIGAVAKDWEVYDLRKCEVSAASSDQKVFKILVPPTENGTKKTKKKEERFRCNDMCSRNIWIRKMLVAKTGNFTSERDTNVIEN